MASRRTPESKPRSKPAKPQPVTAAPPPEPKRAPAKKPKPPAVARPEVTPDVRRGMIAKAAYLRAERRGFASGNEHEDWMAAEAEVDQLLSADPKAPQ
jgi:hypothetical protein